LKQKSRKDKFGLAKVTKRVQNPWLFFQIDRPLFWTSFLPVSSIKGMPAAML